MSLQNYTEFLLVLLLFHLKCSVFGEHHGLDGSSTKGNPPSCSIASFPKITKQLPNGVYPLWSHIVLECEASGHNVSYRWKVNGKDISPHETRVVLNDLRNIIIIKSQQDDIVEYQCFAENEFGTASSNPIFYRKPSLNIMENKSISVQKGKPFKLQCVPDAWPKLKTNWAIPTWDNPTENVHITKGPNGTLYISNMIHTDMEFSCTVSLLIFSTQIMFDINIIESTVSTENAPILQWVDKNVFAVVNETFEIFCIYGGPVLLTTTWRRNGVDILNDRIQLGANNKSLIFNAVTYDDEDTYTCEVSNNFTKIYHEIDLTVNSAPRFEYTSSDTTNNEGDTFEFRCIVKGKPKPSIYWFYNGEPLNMAMANMNIDDDSLNIDKVSVHNMGIYGCLAKNDIGYIYHEIKLCVNVTMTTKSTVATNSQIIQFVPYQNPDDVHAIKLKPSGFIISWTSVQQKIEFFYRVYWKPDFISESWNVIDIIDVNQNYVIVPNQVFNKPYRYKVICANANGESSAEHQEHVIQSDCNFQAFPLGSRALLVQWQKSTGHNLSYTISVGMKTIHVNSINQTKVTGLHSNGIYRLSLRYDNASMQQKDCIIESRTRKSNTRSPSVRPDKPSFTWRQWQRAIKVTWMPNVYGNPGANFYVKFRENGQNWTSTDVITDDDFKIIHGLSTGIYEFAVVSLNEDFKATSSDVQNVEIVKIEMAKKKNLYELEGSEMEFNCSVRNTYLLPMKKDLTMEWNWPNKTAIKRESRVKVLDPLKENCASNENGREKCDLIYRLIVKNVNKNKDQGLYRCTLKDDEFIIDSATLNVTNILAICDTFVNITLRSGANSTLSSNESSVTWIAEIFGYPNPSFSWYSNNGDEIPWESKNNTNLSFTSTEHCKIITLTKSNLTVRQSGIYPLIAENGHVEEKNKKIEKFSLQIQGKPEVDLPDMVTVKQGEQASVMCNIFAYPKATIDWTFDCSSGDFCSDINSLNFSTTETEFNQTSIVNFIPDDLGILTCRSYNKFGSSQKSVNINVHDLNEEFGIWTDNVMPIVIDYGISVVCGAAKYKYSDLNWYRNGDLLIKNKGTDVRSFYFLRTHTIFAILILELAIQASSKLLK
ncbi:neuroglian-like [Contarinia nasturtii]|uniref:neuroglian-like n=1 Tax=Contarinia nasturtii TaxID=265458 RepID=UPI0012D3ABA7|nr:neuroglian-like [Contarinia nasturtii]